MPPYVLSIDDVTRGDLDSLAAAEPAGVIVRAPAKINLYLRVGAAREDGYHDLQTVFQAVSMYDDVVATPAGRLVIDVRGDGADTVPRGRDNLAARAARLLGRATGTRSAVRLTVLKGIPVAGGMAGGSADAAATLVACNELWDTDVEPERLLAIAAELGSDVPFALHGRTALGRGRGEQLAPVLTRGTYHWVLGLDTDGLSTAAVYAEFDRLRSTPPPERPRPAPGPEAVLTALRAGDPVALGRALHNDLQPAALRLRPRLRRVLEAGLELGATGAVICGSGPTCAFLARDGADATRLAAALAGMGVCRTVRRAHGPVPGAAVAR